MIDKLYEQFNMQEANPRKLKKLILVDDEVFCQVMVKQMIEGFGGYEVLAFFNGRDVNLSLIPRHFSATKRRPKKSVPSFSTTKCPKWEGWRWRAKCGISRLPGICDAFRLFA